MGKLPFIAISGIFVVLALYVRAHPTGHWQAAVTLDRFGIHSRVMQAFYIWAYYIWKPWWPFDLAPIYMRLVSFQPSELPFLLSAYGVVLLTGLLLWRRRQWPLVLAVWAAYLILLVPVLGLTEHPHFSSDRYSYIPGIGWSVLALGLLLKLPEGRSRRVGLTAGLLLACALGALSYRQVSVWRNTASLYEHTIAALGDHPFRYSFYLQLAPLYKKQGDYPRAFEYYAKIADRNPRRPDVFRDLGDVLVAMGKFDLAAQKYAEGLKVTPNDANLYCGLGQALVAKNDLNGATTNLVRALELNPNLGAAHRTLGEVLKRQGRLEEARAQFERAAQSGEAPTP